MHTDAYVVLDNTAYTVYYCILLHMRPYTCSLPLLYIIWTTSTQTERDTPTHTHTDKSTQTERDTPPTHTQTTCGKSQPISIGEIGSEWRRMRSWFMRRTARSPLFFSFFKCPHTTIYLCPWSEWRRMRSWFMRRTARSPLFFSFLSVIVLLYLCPYTSIYVSLYYYMCVLILVYICPYTSIYYEELVHELDLRLPLYTGPLLYFVLNL
jgi:hypothetical protein